jgi:hypothetical protein
MSKTHLALTKESAIALAVLAGLIAMVIINIALLVPGLLSLSFPPKTPANQSPIDQVTVQQAIKVVTQ